MKTALNFIRHAINASDNPFYSHVHILEGRIKSSDGIITLCAPIPIDIEASPSASLFAKALDACDDIVSISINKSKMLTVASGTFKAKIPCLEADQPDLLPEGVTRDITGALLPTITKLIKIVPSSSPHPWNCGILFEGQSAYATDNSIIVQHWHEYSFPCSMNIPRNALAALLHIGEEPVSIQASDNSVTFHFSDGRWLKTRLLTMDWPNQAKVLLDIRSNQKPFPDDFFPALDRLSKFTDETDAVLFCTDELRVLHDEIPVASMGVPGIADNGAFAIKKLLLLRDIAASIDFSLWPKLCPFFGDKLRGGIMGIRA